MTVPNESRISVNLPVRVFLDQSANSAGAELQIRATRKGLEIKVRAAWDW